jgi:precorrin-6x reductase
LPGDKSVAKCLSAGFESEQIITGVGPFSVEENERLWDSLGVNVVVTKESGREGGFPEKVEAAKRLGIALVVVERPGIMREDDSEADDDMDIAIEVSGVDEAMTAIKRVMCDA